MLQLLNHAQKVFEVGERSRLGVCTWGAASLGAVSHRTLVAQLAEKVDDNKTTVKQAASRLGVLASRLVKKHKIDFVGYFLGGWDPNTHVPACFQVEVTPKGKSTTALDLGICSFAGMPNFFTRVFRGHDPDLPQALLDSIIRHLRNNVAQTAVRRVFGRAFQDAVRPLVAAGHRDIPIREAIDFVYSYLHITVKATKFRFGAPVCGGPIEVGFISSDRRFRWAMHKSFTTAVTEQEGDFDVR